MALCVRLQILFFKYILQKNIKYLNGLAGKFSKREHHFTDVKEILDFNNILVKEVCVYLYTRVKGYKASFE